MRIMFAMIAVALTGCGWRFCKQDDIDKVFRSGHRLGQAEAKLECEKEKLKDVQPVGPSIEEGWNIQ